MTIKPTANPPPPALLERAELPRLFAALQDQGFTIIGPTLRHGAIVLAALHAADDLPAGWTAEQGPGRYRLVRRNDDALFGHAVGPDAWKRYLLPPSVRLWHAERSNGGMTIVPDTPAPPRLAFLGVRPCDVAAIRIQDRILREGPVRDADYAARRDAALIVAVNCTEPGGACFCASMGTGPAAAAGYDLALTELLDGERHYFVVEAGSEAGGALLGGLALPPATAEELAARARALAAAADHMGRRLETDGLADLLYTQAEHPYWDDVAQRCLTCGNCTLACPTCFCTTVEDVTDITGRRAERWRKTDTCFSVQFSHVYGGSVRASARARYRQWLTHKLAAWQDQFGMAGCVGCGRCITWCPVGIDLTEEVQTLRGLAVTAARTEGARA